MSSTGLNTSRSQELHARAMSYLPGGVTGDGRHSTPYPIVFESATGKWLTDVDGNEYLDYHGGFGTAVLGYAHEEVDGAVHEAMSEIGAFVGVPHAHEQRLAERLCGILPMAERVAFCGGGGSDAVYHAVRLARAATGRTKIVKLEGGYQGWHAEVGVSVRPELDDAGYVALPEPVPNSAGSLPAIAEEVLVVNANDPDALERLFAERGHEIAGMIIEPAIFSIGCVTLEESYLELTRALCTSSGSVLIADEIMSGFRAGLQGAGARLGIKADIGAFGKAIANGYVIAVLAGKSDLMRLLSPEGDVFYSGTFNGHPLSCVAAETTLSVLERDSVPERLSDLSDRIGAGINESIDSLGLNATCQTFGSVWNLYFHTTSVGNYRDLVRASQLGADALNERYRAFLRERGIYIHRRHTNRGFIGAAHEESDIDRTIAVVEEFLKDHKEELAL